MEDPSPGDEPPQTSESEPQPASEAGAQTEPVAGPARSTHAARGELPDLATRIQEAQRQARERRVQQGLPADPDDGAYALKKRRKHAPKRGKKHGQFLGTVSDSWEEQRRRP